jgi:hypothetical protein
MKQPISKETAEARVVHKYNKLYKPLIELVDALQELEPGGTLVDDVVLENNGEKVRIAYAARPIMLTIQDKDKAFILRVVGPS